MLDVLTRIFGSRNERLIRGYARYVRAANELEQAERAREAAADLDPSLIVLNPRHMSKES